MKNTVHLEVAVVYISLKMSQGIFPVVRDEHSTYDYMFYSLDVTVFRLYVPINRENCYIYSLYL